MLHVCHLVSGDLWAGAEVMAHHLLRGLRTRPDVALSIILLNEGRLAEELRKAGVSPHILSESQSSFFQLARKIRRILAAASPDIIHSHRYKENLLGFLASRTLKKTRLISTQHGLPESHDHSRTLCEMAISKANFHVLKKHFHVVVGVSHDIQSFFNQELKFPVHKTKVVHNGVEIPRKPARDAQSSHFFIGSSGRLFPVKDYPLMVEIARHAIREEQLRFSLAGEGPEREKLEHAVNEFGLRQSFRLEGHLDDMDTFYSGLDVYLNTSKHEGIPMAILEAMARGLPVVAPNVGGIPEVIQDGVEGFLIEGRDPKPFAEKCLLLYKDKELRIRMSQAARKKAIEAFSVERMVEQYVQIYKDIVARNEKPAC